MVSAELILSLLDRAFHGLLLCELVVFRWGADMLDQLLFSSL